MPPSGKQSSSSTECLRDVLWQLVHDGKLFPCINEMDSAESATERTPLAPSVEKAYYRKCIELKRRLNEVEAANDELKIRRVRLDRGIMKMRLERAFLLDELRKRMDHNVDGSEGSGEEGMATPPPDRPHRDKRRRPESSRSRGQPQTVIPHQSTQYPPHPAVPRVPSQAERDDVPLVPGPDGVNVPANATDADGRYIYVPPQELQQRQAPPSYPAHPPPQQGSPYEARTSIPGGSDRQTNGANLNDPDERERDAPINRAAGAAGEALSAGPSIQEDSNGERKIISSTSAENANAESEQRETSGSTGGGFTAVNQ